jgi:hypothetical protein
VQGFDSLRFSAEDSNVKTEEGWYDFAGEVVVADGLEASNELPLLDSAALSSNAFNYVVNCDRAALYPAKAKAPDVVILDPTIASPAHIELRKWKIYELNRHFQDSWATKYP